MTPIEGDARAVYKGTMFQSFNEQSDPEAGTERLKRLRTDLAQDKLTGFIIPHADEHQSEYLPAAAERLGWLTGFTGSAGMAIVLNDRAALFVDGRYTLQAGGQVDPLAFEVLDSMATSPTRWLAARLTPGDRIGYDPWLMSIAEARRLAETCEAAGATFVALAKNPLDRLWSDRPAPPIGAVELHRLDFAGKPSATKIAEIQDVLTRDKIDAAVLTLPDSIAWLFNIRGADVAHNPAPLAFAIVPKAGKPGLYIDSRKLTNKVRASLAEITELGEPNQFETALKELASARVLLDPKTAAEAIDWMLEDGGATIVEGTDPAILPKARKNHSELSGSRRAHIRDGAAMVRFLAWLERTAPDDKLDEIAAVTRLEELRAETAKADGSELADISFDTIAGAGPNGAIVHYRVSDKTSRRLEDGTLFILDSGGQYRDGTTDITRTLVIGEPTPEMRNRFTLVLKGHIAVATARFPAGTNGAQLDAFARQALWRDGFDFAHGTGHGVGSFLSVHEGPARIAKTGTVPLEAGMILSNEPGYYKEGEYGIRIENLIAVTPLSPIAGGDQEMHEFETLSLCPIDRNLIELSLLSAGEIAWLDAYHARLLPALGHLLDKREQAWLTEATQPLGSPAPPRASARQRRNARPSARWTKRQR